MSRTVMLLAALALPSAALAQTPEQRIESALARASAAGIPVALLETTIAAGRARGVSPERIAAAVEHRTTALQGAQAALSAGGERPTTPELDVAADAVGLGVSAAVLQKLSETSGRERRAAAIAALTQLVALGRMPADALDRVTAALDRGGDALARLPEEAAASGARRGPQAGAGRAGARPGMAGPPAGIPAPGQTPAQRRPPLGQSIRG